MRRSLALFAACTLAVPLPAIAQIETIDPDTEISEAVPSEDLTQTLSDPDKQEQLARTVATLSDVLLDMPLAPIAKALADAGVAAADEVPTDTTLRQLAPEVGDVSREISENLPAMMDAMASMAGALQEMAPVLEDMAGRMKEALPTEHYTEG